MAFPPLRFARSACLTLTTLAVAFAILLPAFARAEPAREEAIHPRRGFLEIARDPDATVEQKRTVAAMMEFVKETDPEDEGKFSADGKFSVRGDRLEMTIMENTVERRFEIKGDVLTLEEEGEKIRYKKVKK